MVYCKDCAHDLYDNCKRDVKINEFTGVKEGYHSKLINNEGKCKSFKPKPKRGFFAKLFGK